MERVGERLRRERESHETSIEALSAASGIGQSYLEALERGEIDALPGPAFGKLYIRAYAEVLGFDPQPWIEDYDREWRSLQGGASEPPPRASAESRPVAAAIARWKESRGVDKSEPEPEAIPEPAAEPIIEPAGAPVVEPVVAPEIEPAPVPVAEPIAAPTVRPVPRAKVVAGPPRRPSSRRLVPALVVVSLVAIASLMCLARRPHVAPSPEPRAPVPQASAPSPPEPASADPAPPARVEPKIAAPKPAPQRERAGAPRALSVTESGTGRRVVNSRLDGEDTEFAEGEAVVFQTRVLGGSRGDVVRHVWIYDGRAQQSIPLRLGGPDWRTFSKKTLYKRGPWRVEARDPAGRVLAQAAFTCGPASR